jgi:hypothetical protein
VLWVGKVPNKRLTNSTTKVKYISTFKTTKWAIYTSKRIKVSSMIQTCA